MNKSQQCATNGAVALDDITQVKVDRIVELIKRDMVRVKALNLVAKLAIPQCYIAAGFVRNLVWDALHNLDSPTPLNDVDVIYFDPEEANPDAYIKYESQLVLQMPELNWQVRNQAIMHGRNGDSSYKSALDAMSYWPEKETAIAIRQTAESQYECIAAFGVESLLKGDITYNPNRPREVFDDRVKSKGWLVRWPQLSVAP
ncbi:nucleotidyltransferase family protein [Pseudoalteromonas luteoviolacea]|nr:nucleotidyltransferase family protein [Pseudoalteromonas luteoviolacea]